MAADPLLTVIGLDHHDRGVPAHVPADATLDFRVAGELGLLFGRDGVHIWCRDHPGDTEPGLQGAFEESGEQVSGADGPVLGCDCIQRVEPFLGLRRIRVDQLMNELDPERLTEIRWHQPRLVIRSRTESGPRISVSHCSITPNVRIGASMCGV